MTNLRATAIVESVIMKFSTKIQTLKYVSTQGILEIQKSCI